MKTSRFDLATRARSHQNQRGIALISVLAVLVLLTLLVVAFMTRATVSRTAASSYRATTTTKVLADTAVGLVQAQINDATGMTVPSGANPVTFCWASQPGAIRVYQSSISSHDNLNTYGKLAGIFRLYSAPSRMTTDLSLFTGAAPKELPASLADMNSKPATWVDLNAPSVDAQGASHYPILDDRSPIDPTKPIVIPGFSVSANTAPGNTLVTTNPPSVPMPVQWLYVLKDGSVIPPSSTTGGVLTFNGLAPAPNAGAIAMPTVKNPIVGRIAYWTDDDSCKVNINTAAGDDVVHATTNEETTAYTNTSGADSIFWSTPMFVSVDDYKLSQFQPARGEFQRYSGHPGTVGLNSLLSSLCGLTVPLDATDTSHNPFYSLTPRYAQGGTLSNTSALSGTGTGNVQDAEGDWYAIDQSNISQANNRLYTSVAEMLFAPGALTGTDRPFSTLATTQAGDNPNAAGVVERANFFLSAHSAAPELNLWGEPRVSIWPINANTAFRSPEDNLIAFDSTVRTASGLEPYFFQRSDATSTTEASLPVGSYASGNSQLLNYLDALTSMSAIPGFGSGFVSKYPNPQTRQILAEIFDYVRTVNVRDPNFPTASGAGASQGRYGVPWGPYYVHDGVVQVAPSANNSSNGTSPGTLGSGLMGWGVQGNASFPVLIEASLQFVAMGTGQWSYTPPTEKNYVPPTGGSPLYPPLTFREIPIPPPQFQSVTAGPSNGHLYPNPTIAYDTNGSAVTVSTPLAPARSTSTFYGDEIVPENTITAGNQAVSDDFVLTHDQYPMSGDTITGGVGSAGYAYGRPADGTTAMQCFLLLTFLNPALGNDVSNPAFSVTVNGLNTMTVTSSGGTTAAAGSLAIPMRFPGTQRSLQGAAETAPPYSRMVFNTDMLGTYLGSTCVGYIPWLYQTGCEGYEGYTQTLLGPSDTIWNSVGDGGIKHCPFYSQLFCVAGIRTPTQYVTGDRTNALLATPTGHNYIYGNDGITQVPPTVANPAATPPVLANIYPGALNLPVALPVPNPPAGYQAPGAVLTPVYANKTTFTINTVALQVFTTTAHTPQLSLNAPTVQESDVTFTASAFLIPTISTTAGRIIGTGTFWGNWNVGGQGSPANPANTGTPGHARLGGVDSVAKIFFLPDEDDRWALPYTAYYGTGSYNTGLFTPASTLNLPTAASPTVPVNPANPDGYFYVNAGPNYCCQLDLSYKWNFDPGCDIIQSMTLSATWTDARDLALAHVPVAAYHAHSAYGATSTMANNLSWDNWDMNQGNSAFYPATNTSFLGTLVPYAPYLLANWGDHLGTVSYPIVPPPAVSSGELGLTKGAYTSVGATGTGPGDWDNGLGNQNDGPWVNMADDGSLPTVGDVDGIYGTMLPYFQVGNGFVSTQIATFSPDRMLPSPVMFGSLPTGVSATLPRPWQTLLFQPGTNAVGTAAFSNHPGQKNMLGQTNSSATTAGLPPDHLLLDLFWMPQAEPYPISQPFSTSGKINLNYEIEPFNYIIRATALRSLFAGEKVALMPAAMAGSVNLYIGDYKGQLTARDPASIVAFTNNIILYTGQNTSPDDSGETRLPVDADATLGLNFSKSKTARPLNQAGTSSGDAYNVDPISSDYDSVNDPHPADATNGAFQTGVAAWYASSNNDSSTNTGTRFFKSASEICEMFLVPQGYTWEQFAGVPTLTAHSWYYRPTNAGVATSTASGDFAMVGDNARERPYSDLYSRLTTKSNVFTVYYTVQALRNAEPKVDSSATGLDQQHWDENKGNVLGESRGSTIIERYIDPNEAMPNCLSTANSGYTSLESYYKWRIVETRQFAP